MFGESLIFQAGSLIYCVDASRNSTSKNTKNCILVSLELSSINRLLLLASQASIWDAVLL